jgi:hypothetical protein
MRIVLKLAMRTAHLDSFFAVIGLLLGFSCLNTRNSIFSQVKLQTAAFQHCNDDTSAFCVLTKKTEEKGSETLRIDTNHNWGQLVGEFIITFYLHMLVSQVLSNRFQWKATLSHRFDTASIDGFLLYWPFLLLEAKSGSRFLE